MIRQVELVDRVLSYDPDADEDMINRAYVFAMKAHGAQKRASGDPYFLHPLEVAGILAAMKLDYRTIVTGLLHDTLEDTVATPEEIEKVFGPDVLRLVDGVTKLSRLEAMSDRARQAENFRKLLLAMSNDIRVLLVKLADRLHNMRTLHFIANPDKRRRIALETMEIFAPLAERLGMQRMKEELEDLSFAVLNPEARASVVSRTEFLREGGGEGLVARIADTIAATLKEHGVTAQVTGREKKPYSIWQKTERKNISFENLSDIMAFRIIVDDVGQCYQALGVVHAAWPMVPGRFKDYISTPKPNGYRSLHTTVIGPERQKIEVQIRSRDMHDIAEMGVAAHWSYKEQRTATPDDTSQYRWLRELLEILENSDPEEFLEHTKLNMFQDQVFCFTPKGDLINLPRNATPVDFAYAVHSGIGDTTVGAKVNGRVVPLRTMLQNGDQVEILRSKNATPNPNWETFVVTGKARSRIRRFMAAQQRDQYISLGRGIAAKAFRDAGHPVNDRGFETALKVLRLKTLDDLYAAVGSGHLTGRQLVEAVFPGDKEASGPESDKIVPITRARTRATADKDRGIPIKGLIPGMAVHYAGCCHPLPGDRIVGIVTTGKGVTIHTIDCEALEQFNATPERWIDVSWDAADEGKFVGRLSTIVANEPGSLSALTTVIAKNRGNIHNLRITNRATDYFELLVDIEVKDVKHLTNIIAALRATPLINSVERAKG